MYSEPPKPSRRSRSSSEVRYPSTSGLVYTLAIVVEVLLWRRAATHPEQGRTRLAYGAASVASIAVAFAIWNASQHGLCDPHSLLQGHAAWHLLCALAAYLLFRLWASEGAAGGSG